MAVQSLIPPLDITWTRLAFARDMIDTNFGNTTLPPKWRTSLVVYYYIVPEEDIADAYPNSRIVYLKLTCSLTGWNPSEDLRDAKESAEESGQLDDLQRTFWEVIIASGWAETYWPCLGAIMQVAVYPNNPEGVPVDDYPYFIDFEPKKRELYEAVTEGSEYLSGTANTTSITKGSTNVSSTEYGGSAGFSYAGFGASASITKNKSDTTINQNTTDTSREARETVSRTTSSSQMYQLFNGYHLGTNRALFVVAPRPHTVSNSSQTEFNLIDGERKLEGLQEVLLVVHMPKTLDGFCVQANLDTGHQATFSAPQHLLLMKWKDDDGSPGPDGDPPPPPPPPPPPSTPVKQLVVTRRIAQSCGTFDENDNFHIRQLQELGRPGVIVGEIALPDLPTKVLLRTGPEGGTTARILTANNLNTLQSQINRAMLDNASSVKYTAKDFVQTAVFKSLIGTAARSIPTPLTELAERGHLSRDTVQLLARHRINTVADLFNNPAAALGGIPEAPDVRIRVIDNLLSLQSRD